MGNPSTYPVTELIMQSLENALKGIDTSRSDVAYWNTVRNNYVVRYDAGFPTLPGYPSCAMAISNIDVDDNLDGDVHSLNTETANILIEGWIEASSNVELELQKFARDIRTAVMEDPRRDELAIHTYVQSVRYIHAEDISIPFSLVEVEIQVRYRTRVGDLETAG